MAKKILIVEDEAQDQEIIKLSLIKHGYEDLIFASTGEEGIVKARSEKPDLVLVDTKLPDMEGFEVCRQIKKSEGLTAKIIVYTGCIDAVDVTKARLAGADDYEVKTEDFGKLLSAVKKLIFKREGGGGGKRVGGKVGE